ncbi:MAG TPA: PilZ domain-containing protein [Desulfobulbaceae bacterium]|nr:PilZ domain-containing protein [Desulfobulbaceae bacterium]
MEKKPSWNDIPSLGLQLETDELNKKRDNRAEVRLPCRDLLELFMLDTGTIAVQVKPAQGKTVQKGLLLDINQKGMGLEIEAHDLKKNDSILIGTVLGQRGFTTSAVVRWARPNKIGVEYINPKPEDYTFLSELYGAKILNNI